jgi:hypothetical protein
MRESSDRLCYFEVVSDHRGRDDDPWRAATWEGAEEAALRAGAALSLPERLLWLEESAALARRLGGEGLVSGTFPPERTSADEVAEPVVGPSAVDTAETGITLLELLHRLGGADIELRRSNATLSAALIRIAGGGRVFVIERTYREGLRVMMNPTPEDVETIRSGDLWSLWNSGRLRWLAGAV